MGIMGNCHGVYFAETKPAEYLAIMREVSNAPIPLQHYK